MLRFTLFMFLISAVPHCPGCKKCLDPDGGCADTVPFRVVDKTNGNDLVLGPNRAYHKDSVHLRLKQPSSAGGTYFMHASHFYMADSIFRSSVHWRVDTFFLYLDQFDLDTLLVQYNYLKDDCCPDNQYGLVSGVLMNGAPAQKSGAHYLFRK